MRAAEIRADVIVAAKPGVTGVYTADPKQHPGASASGLFVLTVALVTIAAEANADWQMVRDVAGPHGANDVASDEVLRQGW